MNKIAKAPPHVEEILIFNGLTMPPEDNGESDIVFKGALPSLNVMNNKN